MGFKKKKITVPYLQGMKPYSKPGQPVSMLTDEQIARQKTDRIKSWVTFYRFNPSFFVEHYMGVKLFPYQRFWINLMGMSTKFVAIASRASAKSWLIAVYAIARCILYPGTKVVLASSTKQQAGLIISEKCQMLYDQHGNIRRETKPRGITANQNVWKMDFKNGSYIKVVVSSEGGRGNRSTLTVLEERRLIDTVVIDSIIRPFLESRNPPYMNDIQYSEIPELREEPQEVIITSAHYKSADWYPETKKFLRMISNGNQDIKALFLDYLISIKHGIKTKKQMVQEQIDIDPITFLMEYGNVPYGSSSTSFYKLGLFNRSIKRSWRPITDEVYITTKKNMYDIPRLPEEMRIISVDIAMRAGSTNDNTIISCARLMPSRKGWITEIVYMESHNGKNTVLQALRIKQIFTEFQGDVLVLDVANAGISVFDSLSSVTKDETRGVEYDAYTVMNDDHVDQKLYDDLKKRTLGKDALPCVFPIYANAPLNSAIAVEFRARLKKRLVSFLVDDNTEEEFLIRAKNKDIMREDNTEIRAYLLQPHLQTSLMINESIALEMMAVAGLIKLVEPENARKDRYTSVSYLNYYVSLMDKELLKETDSQTDEEAFLGVSIVV